MHLFCNTGYNTVLRHAATDRRTDPIFLAAVMSTAIAAPAAIGIFVAKIDWSLYTPRLLALYAASIATTLLFHIGNSKALENTEASVFSFLYNFRIGIVTLLGISILGESIIAARLIGGALVFVAGFVLMGRSTAKPAGVLFSILTSVLISVLNIFEKYLISQVGYAAYMFPSALIAACLLWAFVLAGKRPLDKAFLKSGEMKTLMVFRCVSAYGFTFSLSIGALISVATYISALSCVTTPIAAVIFLKERDSLLKKALAGVIALAGITIIFLAALQ